MPELKIHEMAPGRPRALRAGRGWVAIVLLVSAAALAHDWSDLTPASFETRELEAALAATEALQSSFEAPPPLAPDAWAFEWWRWFAAAAGLDDVDGVTALTSALAEAGFPHAGEDAVPAWRDVMEHLVMAADADRLRGVDLDALEAAFDGTVPAADPVRLSYLASLAGEPAPDAVLAPFLARFDALVAAARGVAR
jgi:hypothetical protein